MRQRVGLARALVVHPDLLLMDEPFSALDVLTAETLRTDLIDLWSEGKLPIKSVLMVTHNIEEAVLMCDRILVFSSNPGRVASELRVPFPHPRNRLDAGIPADGGRHLRADDPARHGAAGAPRAGADRRRCSCTRSRPTCSPAWPRRWPRRPTTAGPTCRRWPASLQLELDELLPMGEALQLLGLGRARGRRPAADRQGPRLRRGRHRRAQAASSPRRCARNVPLAAQIRRVLDERPATGPRRCASATSSRTRCRPITPTRRCARRSPGAATPSCIGYDEEADQFFLDEAE